VVGLLKVREQPADASVGVVVAAEMDAVDVPTYVAFGDGTCEGREGGRET